MPFVRAREPHVHAIAALWSPDTGIVEAEALVKAMEHVCRDLDVAVVVGSPLVGAERAPRRHAARDAARTVRRAASSSMPPARTPTKYRRRLARSQFQIYPCRGEYAELKPSRRTWVNGLVYPPPHASGAGLGVHLARTTWGSVTLGPTIHYQPSKDDYEGGRLAVEDFVEPAKRLLSGITVADLQPGGSGIRAKLHGPDKKFADFLIERDRENPSVIQAAGIDSPGLTSSLAIGELVASIATE